jgi:hypothetical protein
MAPPRTISSHHAGDKQWLYRLPRHLDPRLRLISVVQLVALPRRRQRTQVVPQQNDRLFHCLVIIAIPAPVGAMLLAIGRVLAAISAVVFGSTIFVLGELDNEYVYYPRTPDSTTNRIVPYAVKGIVVYVTPCQRNVLRWLVNVEVASLAILTVLIVVGGVKVVTFSRRSNKAPPDQ